MASTSTLVDRVKIVVQSSGTGPFQLGAAVPAYRGVEALADGATYSYAIESGSTYEVGTGVYLAATATLVRTPQISSNGGTAVGFPANAELSFTALAQDIVATGATFPIVDALGNDPSVAPSQRAVTAGILPIATKSVAEAGTASDVLMTPQRVQQAIAAQVPPLLSGITVVPVGTRTALAALPALGVAYLAEAGREGQFVYSSADLSSMLVTASFTSTSVAASVITRANHGLNTGEAIYPTTTANGLTANTFYYVIRVSADTFRLATSYEAAVGAAAMTLSGTTNFTVKRYVDPRQAIVVIPNGKASDGSQGAWVRKYGNLAISVAWAGAATDITDNSAAFAACANLFASARITIPTGDFRFTLPVRWNGRSLVWQGAGRDITRLFWTADSSGFDAGGELPARDLECYDFTIAQRVQTSDKSGIRAVLTADRRPCAIFERLHVRGDDGSGNPSGLAWFWRGISLKNAMQPLVNVCLFQGATGSTITDVARADAAVFLEADVAAVIPRVSRCHSLNYGSGVKIRSVSSPSIEGIYISENDFVFVNVGIDIVFSSGAYRPPQINLVTNHSEALYRAVSVEGGSQINVRGNLFYGNPFAASNDQIINLFKCTQANINDNMIDTRLPSTCEGIWIEDCDKVDIYDNDIVATDTHIAFVGSTSNSTERANRCFGTGAAFANVGTAAATNKGGKSLANPGYEWTAEGLLRQTGTYSATVSAAGDLTVTFARAFNTLQGLTVVNSNGAAGTENVVVMSRSATGFVARFVGAASAARECSYTAWGI